MRSARVVLVVGFVAALGLLTLGGGLAQAQIPTVVTGAVSVVTQTSATVEGTVSPEGLTIASCFFEYGEGLTKPCNLSGAEIGTGSEPVTVSTELEGLEPDKTYPYHLVAVVEGQPTAGGEEQFATLPLATVTTESPTEVKPRSATLNGQLALLVAGEAEYYWEYGKEVSEKTTTATTFTGEQAVQLPVAELEPETTYHARLVAEVAGHIITTPGPEIEFITSPLATATTEAASAVTTASATLNGTVVLNAADATNYYFEYGETTGEFKTAPVAVPSGEGAHVVSADVTELHPNSSYHYRLVAEVVGNPTLAFGEETEFKTTFLKSVVTIEPATSVSRTTASLRGTINPEKAETTYYFEYEYVKDGQTHVLQTRPTTIDVAQAGLVAMPIGPEGISELKPGTTYHYRLVATNGAGTTASTDGEFTTAPPSPPSVISESVQALSQTTATIGGTIDPNGLQTRYVLELGTDASYGTPIFGEIEGSAEGKELVFALTNLLPGTTYHFRLVAINPDGTIVGADQAFTTPGFPSVITPPPPVRIIPFTPPVETKHATPRKAQTKAQKLAKALKACKREPKKKRSKCMKQANRKYGPAKKTKKKGR